MWTCHLSPTYRTAPARDTLGHPHGPDYPRRRSRSLTVIGGSGRRLSDPAATPANPFPSPSYLLALRQGSLRDDLIALAAERGVSGWFNPPLCIFHELPEWLGATERKPFARIRRVDRFLEALERLVGELVAEGVTPEALAEAAETDRHRDRFERARDRELAAIYRRYLAELDRAGLRDGRDALADSARAIQEDADELERRLGQRREVRFFGLHDTRGGWRGLLRALSESSAVDRVAVYASDVIDFGQGIDVDLVALHEPERAAMELFAPGGRRGGHFETIEAPTVQRELGEVGRRVRELVDRDIPPHRIAVIPRQGRPYVDLVLRVLAQFGVPSTARRRYSYREIPVVRAILALFAGAADGWDRGRLVDLADLPYFDHRLDSRVVNFIGFRRVTHGLEGWERALRALERESRDHEAELAEAKEDRERPPPSPNRVAKARRAFQDFAVLARELEQPRALAEWLRFLQAFVARDPWGIVGRVYAVPEDRVDLAKRDLAGWRGLVQILDEWLTAVDTWGGGEEILTVVQFHQRLQEMLAGDTALWTEVRQGVQVAEALAAAYRSFDHVFLVGMEAGRFPLFPPRSPIFDEEERAALVAGGLSLDLRHHWEERERSLFRVLVAGAREGLTLSYPGLSTTGAEVIRSSFVDALADVSTEVPALVDRMRVSTPGMPTYASPTLAEHIVHVVGIERLRDREVPSPYTGCIEGAELVAWLSEEFGDDRIWSPTQLEAYVKCPWAYFSSRLLRLEKLEDPDPEMEPAVRGRVLHAALAGFYDRAVDRNGGQPAFLRATDLDWAEPMLLEALDRTFERFGRTVWIGAPVLRAAKREELRRILGRYLRWEVALHEDMFDARKRNAPRMLRTAVALHERRFEGAVLERDGVRFVYRGAVDRVEVGVDDRVPDAATFVAAIDYKTSQAAAPGGGENQAWDDGVVLQLPLYAHALEQLVSGARVARIEYRALMQQRQVHTLELHQVDRKTSLRYPNTEDQAKLERALEKVPGFVRRIRQGAFPVKPAPSCKCPRFCHAWDICRVAGGPQLKEPWR